MRNERARTITWWVCFLAILGAAAGAPYLRAGWVALVTNLQGRNLSEAQPADGQAVVWNNTNQVWEPGSVAAAVSNFNSSTPGLVPNPGGSNNNNSYSLRGDGTWGTISASTFDGDMDGTTNKYLNNSGSSEDGLVRVKDDSGLSVAMADGTNPITLTAGANPELSLNSGGHVTFGSTNSYGAGAVTAENAMTITAGLGQYWKTPGTAGTEISPHWFWVDTTGADTTVLQLNGQGKLSNPSTRNSGAVGVVDNDGLVVANAADTYRTTLTASAANTLKIDGILDLNNKGLTNITASEAQYDLLVRGASTWGRLAAGNEGEFLKVSGGSPTWTPSTPTGGVTLTGDNGITIDGIGGSPQYGDSLTITPTYGVVASLGAADGNGSADTISRSDHVHKGVKSIAVGTGLAVSAATGDVTVTVTDSAVTPGTYGSATQVAVIAVDQQGRLTSASNTTVSGVVPSAHASSHQNGGSDEVATATAAANAIPKAGAGGTLDSAWVPDLSGTYAVAAKGVTNGDSHDHVGDDGAAIVENALSFTDNTTANFSTSAHGLVPKGTNVGNFLKDDGTWAAASGSAFSGDVLSTTNTVLTNVRINDGTLGLWNATDGCTPTAITGGINLNGTLTAGNITDSGLTSTRVVFAGTGGLLSDSTGLIWNDTNKSLTVTAATLPANALALSVTGTLGNNSTTYDSLARFTATSNGTAKNQYAFDMILNSGGTGNRVYAAGRFINAVAGSGNSPFSSSSLGNFGSLTSAEGTGSGANIAVYGMHYGNYGSDYSAGGCFVQSGGCTQGAALICSNQDTVTDIFRAYDNAAIVFKIANGGLVSAASISTTNNVTVATAITAPSVVATTCVKTAAAGATTITNGSTVTTILIGVTMPDSTYHVGLTSIDANVGLPADCRVTARDTVNCTLTHSAASEDIDITFMCTDY